jgi:hypothetical protein
MVPSKYKKSHSRAKLGRTLVRPSTLAFGLIGFLLFSIHIHYTEVVQCSFVHTVYLYPISFHAFKRNKRNDNQINKNLYFLPCTRE